MYRKKLDFELSSLKLDVFMYVEVKECVGGRNPKKKECVSKLTLDAVWKFGGSSSNIDPVSSIFNISARVYFPHFDQKWDFNYCRPTVRPQFGVPPPPTYEQTSAT